MEEEKTREKTSVWRFAMFFKSYGVALGTVLAAVPVLTNQLDVFPSFAATRGSVSATTSIMSLLAIGLLFGTRRWIGSRVFPSSRSLSSREMRERNFYLVGVPASLIVASLLSMLSYLSIVQQSITTATLRQAYVDGEPAASLFVVLADQDRASGQLFESDQPEMKVVAVASELSPSEILLGGLWEWLIGGNRSRRIEAITPEAVTATMERTPLLLVPNRHWLLFLYVVMFLTAVLAFVWMGLVEYLREELGLTDRELLERPYGSKQVLHFKEPTTELVETIGKGAKVFKVPIYYAVEHDPAQAEAALEPIGPFCADHDNLLVYCTPSDAEERVGEFIWVCVFGQNDDESPKQHELFLPYDRFDALRVSTAAARDAIDALKRAGSVRDG